MKHVKTTRVTGLFIFALAFFFPLTSVGQVSAKEASLKSLMSKNGISMKLVKLDRADGFRYGISFTGPRNKTIVMALGLDRMFLVQADGNDIILQADGNGSMQIIHADAVDISYVLCVSKAVIEFFQSWTVCAQGDTACYFVSILSLFETLTVCNTGVTS